MRKAVLGTLIAIAGLLLVVGATFFRPDLSREDLGEYVDGDSQFLELPSGAIAHYRDQGNRAGPAVVLLHGGLGSLHNWEPWMEFLAKEYRVVRVDLPAHGLTGRIPGDIYTRGSMVQFVHEFLAEIRVDRFSLIGHSMGGGVALQYALDHPQQIVSMILVGPEGVPGDEGYDIDGVFVDEARADDRSSLENVSLSWTDRLLTYFASPWIVGRTLEYMVGDASLVTPEFSAQFARILRHTGNRYAIALMFRQYSLTEHGPRDLEPRLGEVSVPVLLQIGQEDPLVPPAVGEKFQAGLPNSELKLYAGVGHLIMHEAAETSATDAVAFLDPVAPSRAARPN